jgi:hypothetical protein
MKKDDEDVSEQVMSLETDVDLPQRVQRERWMGSWQPRICIWGKDEQHDVRNVHFEKVLINGQSLNTSYPELNIGKYTHNITFNNIGSTD